jgi:cell division protein FtsQ
MDQRLAERRRRVAEDRARSNLARLVRILVVLALLGGVVWLAQSPFLSVGEIVVRGSDRVDVSAALTRHQVTEGRPMLLVDIAGARDSLLEDAWVAEARIAREWPTGIVVEIVERVPAAAVLLEDGWWLVSGDATLLEPMEEAPPDLPVAELDDLDSDDADALEVSGAVEYLAALPAELQAGARVVTTAEGLEATVTGFTVRLGRPFDMAEKAAVTAAMIESGVEEGSILTVVAPASPALLPPGAVTDTTDGSESETPPEPGATTDP